MLRRAREAHGSTDASTPLPEHKLQVLQGWVEQLAEAHRIDSELKMLPPVQEIAALPVAEGLALNPPSQTESTLPTVESASNVRQASYQRTDPFDPAAFNERHAPVAQTPVAPTVPHVLAPSLPTVQTPAAE